MEQSLNHHHLDVILQEMAALFGVSRRDRNADPQIARILLNPGCPGIKEMAGILAISILPARRQAEERSHSLTIEIKVLMLHGLLHLAGYDHETDEGEMARREQKLRMKLRLPDGLIERADAGGNGKPARGPRR